MEAESVLAAAGPGPWRAHPPISVSAEQLRRYARATGIDASGGEPDIPVFGAALALPALEAAAFEVIPEHLRDRGLHAAHTIVRRRRMTPGAFLIRTRSRRVRSRRGAARIVVDSETRSAEGPIVEEQTFVVALRGVAVKDGAPAGGQAVPPPPPAAAAPPPPAAAPPSPPAAATPGGAGGGLGVFTVRFPPGTAAAYAEASGDHRAIHLDDAAARAHGLPGAINHGLCTLAFVVNGVHLLADPDMRRLARRVTVRFTGIVLPSMTVETRVHERAPGLRSHLYAFESTADGAPALGGGEVDLTEPSRLPVVTA